jgi:hypothetical protein
MSIDLISTRKKHRVKRLTEEGENQEKEEFDIKIREN